MKRRIFLFTIIVSFFFTGVCLAFEPSSNEIYNGIDVSEWQEIIDFKKVKEDEIDVVYIKASQGTDYIDPYFERNYKNAKDNGLKIGVYHFLTARTIEEAREEADFFAAVISKKEFDCKLAMDFEVFGKLNKIKINEISKAFLERLEEKTKKELVIYTDVSNAINIFDEELARKYPIWIAEYGVLEPSNNEKWETWVGFQYADNGRIRGIRGYVDKDMFTNGIFLSNAEVLPENYHINNRDRTRKVKVRRGDTLSKLAIEYKTTINEIVELNKIKNRNLIYIGEILEIPYSAQEHKGETNHIIYTIKRGDTLSKIAKKFNISLKEIVRLNDIKNINLIYAGETLRIEIKL